MPDSANALVSRYAPNFPLRHCGNIHTDTSQFMNIDYGDVISLDGLHYLVLRNEVERRFGLDDPKYWVKRCQVLETGERKILKLVFHETFPLKIGDYTIRCHRSPEKEARILNLVRQDIRFMQGHTCLDTKRNNVRIIDIIQGQRLDTRVEDLEMDHETYFHTEFPAILEKYLGSMEAIAFLHANFEKHGDIRRDHLWVEYDTGHYRWIDFDYAFDFHENPFGLDIFGLGNILMFLTGKGEHTISSMQGTPDLDLSSYTSDDFSLMFPHRLANLRKLFPYIPKELNNVLTHFSAATYVFYESVDEMLEELRTCLPALKR
jgi:hypothetical protein